MHTLPGYEPLLERIAAWASAQRDIRAAIIVGSRARTDHRADEWSDLDVVILATDPRRYLATSDWVESIGKPWLTVLEKTATGEETERRVLFEGGLDVDLALVSCRKARLLARLLWLRRRFPRLAHRLPQAAQRAMQGALPFVEMAGRGMQLLVDKDGIGARLARMLQAEATPCSPPPEGEFLQVANDFWYHAVWTAKKLRRGELWTASSCCDSYMKWLLLRVIAWHARAGHGWDYDTWHGGRFLEEWADPRAVAGLGQAFAHYDEADLWRALRATMSLFRRVAVETAQRLGYAYPMLGDERATALVTALLPGPTAAGPGEQRADPSPTCS